MYILSSSTISRDLPPFSHLRNCQFTAFHLVIQCQQFIPTLNALAAQALYRTAHTTAIQFPGNVCMDDLTTELSFDSKATWVIDVLSLFFDLLSVGVCTTRHWRTSGRLGARIKCLYCRVQPPPPLGQAV